MAPVPRVTVIATVDSVRTVDVVVTVVPACSFQGQNDGNQGGRGWRDQDLLERDRRLNAAGGFFKRHRQDEASVAEPGRSSTSVPRAPSRSPSPSRSRNSPPQAASRRTTSSSTCSCRVS